VARLHRLLDALASDQPAPAGGSAAAATVAIAAALLEKVASLSARHWSEAAGARERAGRLRLTAEELLEADVDAYLGYLEARRQARDQPESDQAAAIATAFELTVTVPLEIVRAASNTVELAAELAEQGNPNLRADAVTVALLAGAGGDAAARLVAVNLGGATGDARTAEARRLTRSTRKVVDRLARPDSAVVRAGSPRRARR
jgi:formiminotetrahydrofolate cyclodeaminase